MLPPGRREDVTAAGITEPRMESGWRQVVSERLLAILPAHYLKEQYFHLEHRLGTYS